VEKARIVHRFGLRGWRGSRRDWIYPRYIEDGGEEWGGGEVRKGGVEA